jgi:hypothetical protein
MVIVVIFIIASTQVLLYSRETRFLVDWLKIVLCYSVKNCFIVLLYSGAAVPAEPGDAKPGSRSLRGAGERRTEPAVGKPEGRRRRAALPGGGRPGVRA